MENYYVSGCIELEGTVGHVEDDTAEFFTLCEKKENGQSHALLDCVDRLSVEAAMAVYVERDALQEQVRALVEQESLLRECRSALDALIKNKPALSGILCGSTTLGNLKASLYSFRDTKDSTYVKKDPIKAVKITEHSGCGFNIQVDMLTVRMKRGEVVVQMTEQDFKRISAGEQP